jgi:hypothetical protein
MHNWWFIDGIRICDWTFEQVVMHSLSGDNHPPVYNIGDIPEPACRGVIMLIVKGI